MNLPVNITTISNSFCPSYTSYSTYVESYALLRKKAQAQQGELGTRNNQPFRPQLCQMFASFRFFHQQTEG